MNSHDAFLCTLSDLWHEHTKWSHLDNFLLGLVMEEIGGTPAVHVTAEWIDNGKLRKLVGPYFILHQTHDWEDLTHRLREVTDRLPRASVVAGN